MNEMDYRIQVAERLSAIETTQANQDEKLDKILAHVEKTNGRVTSLEQWKAVVKSNIALIATIAGAVASAVLSIGLRLIGG